MMTDALLIENVEKSLGEVHAVKDLSLRMIMSEFLRTWGRFTCLARTIPWR